MSEVPLISIVDDDALVGDGIAALVESLGYNAVTFTSAEHFLRSDVIKGGGTSDAGHCHYRLPERETPHPCARKRSGRLLKQAIQ